MDIAASRKFLENSINRLREVAPQLGIASNDVVQKDGQIYVLIRSRTYGRNFTLRASVDNAYPENPADYAFVNPENWQDSNVAHWPNDGGQAFKLENPPWICMAGTRAWVQHNHPNPGFQTNLIENVVFSVFSKLNKVT
jgi:hypothetical protein